eukprot:837159-Rhodomonas_salina.1
MADPRGTIPCAYCYGATRCPVLRWHMLLPGDRPYIELRKSAPLSLYAPTMRFPAAQGSISPYARATRCPVLRKRMVQPEPPHLS